VGATGDQVRWLTAYALGLAFSVPSDASACTQLLAVTSDASDLRAARTQLGRTNVGDPETRNRASQLLSLAVRHAESAVPSADDEVLWSA
jgi:hypothetical protein